MTLDTRQTQLKNWLERVLKKTDFHLTPASSDASFRRYFRVHFPEVTLIAMDAPPEKENSAPFVAVAKHLLDIGLNVPQILASDLDLGFMVMKDLGRQTYLDVLDTTSAAKLYQDACDALVTMQKSAPMANLPDYDGVMLTNEMQLFIDWYLARHCQYELTAEESKLLQSIFDLLATRACSQGQVMVHRDYHARNLMQTEDNNPGILDFQDAVIGSITYDLVSLLRDAYIQWDEPLVIDWAARYWESAKAAGLPVSDDFSQFYQDFEWMGAQRHIKILGIFARLNYRDGKSNYLDDMPLVMQYLRAVCERYLELRPLLALLDKVGLPPQEGL